ncbi:hypothetical protein FISHEDRAFT_62491 [Fistulina hepatica ATCC 64428]|nr:hypothetical protein FISHEDRAFT_62491 [Fistulina hepatica ATCC 64428]
MSRPYSIVLLIVCILILACGPVSLVNASDEHEGDCTGARMTNKMYPQKCHDAGGVGWENPSVPGSCHKPLTAAHNAALRNKKGLCFHAQYTLAATAARRRRRR